MGNPVRRKLLRAKSAHAEADALRRYIGDSTDQLRCWHAWRAYRKYGRSKSAKAAAYKTYQELASPDMDYCAGVRVIITALVNE